MASTTATLRVLGDRHYASDVLTGALIGFGIGYGLPTLLHYGSWNETGATAKALSAGLTPMSGGAGLQVRGLF